MDVLIMIKYLIDTYALVNARKQYAKRSQMIRLSSV